MVIGVFGLSASGKTTLFSLLTGMQLDPAARRKDWRDRHRTGPRPAR